MSTCACNTFWFLADANLWYYKLIWVDKFLCLYKIHKPGLKAQSYTVLCHQVEMYRLYLPGVYKPPYLLYWQLKTPKHYVSVLCSTWLSLASTEQDHENYSCTVLKFPLLLRSPDLPRQPHFHVSSKLQSPQSLFCFPCSLTATAISLNCCCQFGCQHWSCQIP